MLPIIVNNIRRLSTTPNVIQKNFIEVSQKLLHYVKVGHGPRTLLFMPGGLGAGWSHFRKQLSSFDPEEYTMIAWDPPGYGLSRPPARVFKDYYQTDAEIAMKMMEALNFPEYSLLGWSGGATTALIMAAADSGRHRAVQRLVVWGGASYVSDVERKATDKYRHSLDNWNPQFIQMNQELYGKEEFDRMFKEMFDYFCSLDDICSKDLHRIQCPTLIVHGDKDELVELRQAEYLKEQIPNSHLHRFPDGEHNVHARNAAEFNKIVDEFLRQ